MKSWPAITDIVNDVRSGKKTAQQNVKDALSRIKEFEEYKAIIAPIEDRAIKRAQEIDKQIKNGEPVGRLAGVPFVAKDNFLTFGSETTAASNILKGFKAPYQATAIQRLEAEDAICVGKTNLDAFAHGSSTENSDFFVTKNPHDKTRVPGGTSGGSASAVALGITPFALGTDTGGSIRQPASFCGVVGYKPTYGLVSRSGVIATVSSTDVIGPLSKNVDDTALVLDVMSGVDELDATTIEKDESGYMLSDSKQPKTVGVIKQWYSDGVDDAVKNETMNAADRLKKAGHKVVEVSLPTLDLSLACYYIINPAEISSNLMRYDGQRYGFSANDASNLEESYVKSRSQGLGDEAKRRIMIGTYVLSSGYYDAFYKKAQTVRTKLINEFNDVFKKVDFLIGPVAPTPAFKIGQNTDDPLKMYLADIMTVGPSLVGVPAISLPCGKDGKLPIGLQIIAAQRNDRQLLNFAKTAEKEIK